ncbi:MAG TPA: VOC family protein [Methanocellaceae archaeon]
MIEKVSHVTVLVRDIDEALKFYREKFGLEVAEDSKMPTGDRWLTVTPHDKNVQIVLQKPSAAMFGPLAEEMMARVGKAPVMAFKVDDCQKTYDEFAKKGVKTVTPPADLGFAIEATVEDLYGNPIILMQSR